MTPEAAQLASRLAPDPASLAAAQRIAVKNLWPVLGRSERAIWGEHIGSARYVVAVDLAANVARCTCPSRKQPCKHALALMLIAADGLPLGMEPDAVERWLEQRAKAATKERGPVKDLEAQADRREQREARVREGIHRLDGFLDDVLRQGLGSLDGAAGHALLDGESRRLVDAQAPGLASRVRGLVDRINQGGDWAGDVLARLGRLALLSEAHAHLDALPPLLRADVRQLIGFQTSEEEVRQHGDVVTDRWFVMADVIEIDGPLRIGRTWLRGRESERAALVLRFAAGGAPFATLAHWLPGHDVDATLAFYPSARPERALLVEVASPEPIVGAGMPGAVGIAGLLSDWADALAVVPFLDRMAAVLGPVEVTASHAYDGHGAVPLVLADPAELLAVAGGGPVTLCGIFTGDGGRFIALGVSGSGGEHAFTPLGAREPGPPEHRSRWSDIAVVGTAKRKIPDDMPTVAGERTPERRLVVAAGVEAVRRSAGVLPDAAPAPYPRAPAETRPVAPRRIVDLILPFFGDDHPLVPEALTAIAARGLRLPFDVLASALRHARAAGLLDVLGARGRWLAELGVAPAWTQAYRAAPDDEDPAVAFVEGAGDQRLHALEALIRRDRAAARALLARTWKEDNPDSRRAWLAVLGAALVPEDVPFLEPIATHDRSAPVRKTARVLLGRIPGTAVYERQRARIAKVASPLTLPDLAASGQPDADWVEDGVALEIDAPLGDRGRLLAALTWSAPLDLWSEVLGAAPTDVVRHVVASEHAHAWLLGATQDSASPAWTAAVAAGVAMVTWPPALQWAIVDRLRLVVARVADNELRDRIAARLYKNLGQVVVASWGPELSRVVLANLEATRLLPSSLPIASAIHPSLLGRALDLEVVRRAPRVAAALELRRRLHAELAACDLAPLNGAGPSALDDDQVP